MKLRGLFIILSLGLVQLSLGQSYNYIQVAKENDSIFTFTIISTFEEGVVNLYRKSKQYGCETNPDSNSTNRHRYRTDTIRFYNPSTNQLYNFSCHNTKIIDSNFYATTFSLNTNQTEFNFFNIADSLFVFFQTYNCSNYFVTNIPDGVFGNFVSEYNFNIYNNITVALVFPKNYQKVSTSKGTYIKKNFNLFNPIGVRPFNSYNNSRLIYCKNIFFSPSYYNSDGD